MSDGESLDGLPPRSGTTGEASPVQAEQWIEQWRSIGGGVSITVDQKVSPWRYIPAGLHPEVREICDTLQTGLLKQLDETPGLAAAVRRVVSSNAMLQMRRALNAMGKEKK